MSSNDSSSESSRASSNSTEDESGEDLKPIGAYIKNRREMVKQMLHAVPARHLNTILPDVLKDVSLAELEHLCAEQIEVMSKKRIRYILDGKDMTSSSGTEDSTSSEDEKETIPQQVQPKSARSSGTIASSSYQDVKRSPEIQQQPDSTSTEQPPAVHQHTDVSNVKDVIESDENVLDSNENIEAMKYGPFSTGEFFTGQKASSAKSLPSGQSPQSGDLDEYEEAMDFEFVMDSTSSLSDEGELVKDNCSDEIDGNLADTVQNDGNLAAAVQHDKENLADMEQKNENSACTERNDENLTDAERNDDNTGNLADTGRNNNDSADSEQDAKSDGECGSEDSDDNKPLNEFLPDSNEKSIELKNDEPVSTDQIFTAEENLPPKVDELVSSAVCEQLQENMPHEINSKNNDENNGPVRSNDDDDEIFLNEETAGANLDAGENENQRTANEVVDDDQISLDYDETPLNDFGNNKSSNPDSRNESRASAISIVIEEERPKTREGDLSGDESSRGVVGVSPPLPSTTSNDKQEAEESRDRQKTDESAESDKEEGEIENYDSDEDDEPATSKYVDRDLYPPGMEPPRSSADRNRLNSGVLQNDGFSDDDKEKLVKKSSLVSIKALYNQLKAEKRKQEEAKTAKVYTAPLPAWTLDEKNKAKAGGLMGKVPAGPKLPPETETAAADSKTVMDAEVTETVSAAESSAVGNPENSASSAGNNVKKSSKKKSSVLTPEFLEDLNRKKQEHEMEMAKKAEMLETLKRKRQMLEQEEKETERMFKKRNELHLNDDITGKSRKKSKNELSKQSPEKDEKHSTTSNLMDLVEEREILTTTKVDNAEDGLSDSSPPAEDTLPAETVKDHDDQSSGRSVSDDGGDRNGTDLKDLGKNLSVSVRMNEHNEISHSRRLVTVNNNEKADKMRDAFKLSSSSSLEEGEVEHLTKQYGDYDRVSSDDDNERLFVPTGRPSKLTNRRQSSRSNKPKKSRDFITEPRGFTESRIISDPRHLPAAPIGEKSRDHLALSRADKKKSVKKYKREYQPDDYDSDFLKRIDSESGDDIDPAEGKSGSKRHKKHHRHKKQKKFGKKSKKRSESPDPLQVQQFAESYDGNDIVNRPHPSGFKQEEKYGGGSRVDSRQRAVYTGGSNIEPSRDGRIPSNRNPAERIVKYGSGTEKTISTNRGTGNGKSVDASYSRTVIKSVGSDTTPVDPPPSKSGSGSVGNKTAVSTVSAAKFVPTSNKLLQKLELYELEMRARAIRALMKKQTEESGEVGDD